MQSENRENTMKCRKKFIKHLYTGPVQLHFIEFKHRLRTTLFQSDVWALFAYIPTQTLKSQTHKSVAFHTLAFCPWHSDHIPSCTVRIITVTLSCVIIFCMLSHVTKMKSQTYQPFLQNQFPWNWINISSKVMSDQWPSSQAKIVSHRTGKVTIK